MELVREHSKSHPERFLQFIEANSHLHSKKFTPEGRSSVLRSIKMQMQLADFTNFYSLEGVGISGSSERVLQLQKIIKRTNHFPRNALYSMMDTLRKEQLPPNMRVLTMLDLLISAQAGRFAYYNLNDILEKFVEELLENHVSIFHSSSGRKTPRELVPILGRIIHTSASFNVPRAEEAAKLYTETFSEQF